MVVTWRALRADSMRDFEGSDTETIHYVNVASSLTLSDHHVAAFFETLKGDEAHAAIFVCKIGPNDIVKYVLFDCIDCTWERRQSLGF